MRWLIYLNRDTILPMKKTLVWGFDQSYNIDVLTYLQDKKIIDLKYWVKEEDKKDKVQCDDVGLFFDFFLFSQFKPTTLPPLAVFRALEGHMLEFVMMHARHQMAFYPFESVLTRNIYDDYNLFYRLVSFFYEKLTEHKVELVIFANIFHEGADYILYLVAQHLNIQTVMFYQSLFPNKAFCIEKIEEMGGILESRPQLSSPSTVEIPRGFKKSLFYMNQVGSAATQLEELENKYSVREFVKQRKWTFIKNILFNNFDYVEREMQNRGPGSRISKLKQYIQNYHASAVKDIDLSAKFVYFPLHLQPELTTASLGSVYVDQVRAIEDLAEMLPEDMLIYVKENPKQWEAMRPPDFFQRLAQIPKVRLVSVDVDTYALIQKCQFVAVVTGTAGWEAVTGGRNVLTFGLAWYNNLPGVFRFSDSPTVDQIMAFNIDHSQLVQTFKELTTRMTDGIVDGAYIDIYPEFSKESNAESIGSAIHAVVQ
ncbi:MAG: hypothetical protein ACI9BD_001000 [Candidatus Marinamargulisbacteria bacterium]|jgi:hypothetical protein